LIKEFTSVRDLSVAPILALILPAGSHARFLFTAEPIKIIPEIKTNKIITEYKFLFFMVFYSAGYL
jgi:hypothetical protein